MTNYSTTHQQQQDISDHLLLRDKDKATMTEPKKPELKIMLIGKTKVGKTSSMNTLLGRDPVDSLPSASSTTTKCKSETQVVGDCNLVIIDTPGTLHTKKTKADVEKSLTDAIVHAAPGVHMFLLVMKPQPLTKGDMASLKILQEMFGENIKDYTMVLFTKGDKMKEPLSQKDVDDAKINDFSVGWHTFDNTKKNTTPDQVLELLKKINSIVQGREEKKKMYTNKMFEQAQKLKEETRKKMREEQEKQGKKPAADEEQILDATVKKILSQFAGETNCQIVFSVVDWIQKKVEKHCKTE